EIKRVRIMTIRIIDEIEDHARYYTEFKQKWVNKRRHILSLINTPVDDLNAILNENSIISSQVTDNENHNISKQPSLAVNDTTKSAGDLECWFVNLLIDSSSIYPMTSSTLMQRLSMQITPEQLEQLIKKYSRKKLITIDYNGQTDEQSSIKNLRILSTDYKKLQLKQRDLNEQYVHGHHRRFSNTADDLPSKRSKLENPVSPLSIPSTFCQQQHPVPLMGLLSTSHSQTTNSSFNYRRGTIQMQAQSPRHLYNLLSQQSALERETDKTNTEMNSLLTKQTAMEVMLYERFRTKDRIQEYCQYTTREECPFANPMILFMLNNENQFSPPLASSSSSSTNNNMTTTTPNEINNNNNDDETESTKVLDDKSDIKQEKITEKAKENVGDDDSGKKTSANTALPNSEQNANNLVNNEHPQPLPPPPPPPPPQSSTFRHYPYHRNYHHRHPLPSHRNGGGYCGKIHFKRLIKSHTDVTLGDCSFLNTCFHMETCKYIHYEIDMTDVKPQQQQTIPPSINTNNEPYYNQRYHKNISQTIPIVERISPNSIPSQWVQCDLRELEMSVLGKFTVIMADPPWDIHMELPYGTMADEEMRRLNIPCLQDEGYIFLWVTGRAMELGRECLRIWGYERCDELIWVKTNQLQRIIRTGRTGHWLNHGKEHCLVGVKGNPPGINMGLDCDVIVAEVRATSRKPDEVYGLIERLSPRTRKVELFGRPHNVQPNWITLGNQLDGVRLVEPDVVRRFRQRYPTGYAMSSGTTTTTVSTSQPQQQLQSLPNNTNTGGNRLI
ncbi:unnamed protein product, partial [Didymodactylos carnosus]